MRIGHGYDVHKLVEGRKLIIGGVDIPHIKGLLGHSDADVLLHSVIDSLLGALALGDIGKCFPDNDIKFKGISSIILLKNVYKMINSRDYYVLNIDSTIVAEKPKLFPYIDKMRFNLSEVLNIDIDCVSIKATTEEKLGFTGNEEGISATSVCLLDKI